MRWIDADHAEAVEAVLDEWPAVVLDEWLATAEALRTRRARLAQQVDEELAWLASPEGVAWRARIQARLERSREWLAPPSFDAMVRRHEELNEEQRLDGNEHVAALVAALVEAIG